MTAFEILNEECKYLHLISINSKSDKIMATCLCAKIHFALKCGVISEKDHVFLITKARHLLYEGV